MDIRKMSLEDLEKLSYLDISYNIIKFNKKSLTTVEMLKEVCAALNYGDKEYEELIGDFYTSLNLDKRFVLIDGKWDLTENHSVKIEIDDEEEEDYDLDEDEDEDATEDDVVSDDVETMEDIDDDLDDDMEDLNIVDDEEEEEDI